MTRPVGSVDLGSTALIEVWRIRHICTRILAGVELPELGADARKVLETLPLTDDFGTSSVADDTKDAARYRQLKADPRGAIHLLHLLEMGKGSADSFDSMIDRITVARASRSR
jgi:hypothetical protein